jgi:hypothetical protein
VLNSTYREIRNFFEEKGYLDAHSTFEQIPDDLKTKYVKLRIKCGSWKENSYFSFGVYR